MYASFEDPDNLGMYETAVCIITLDGDFSSSTYGTGAYYGSSSFHDGEQGVIDTKLKDINLNEYMFTNPWEYVSNNADYDYDDWQVLIFQDCNLTR